MIAFSGLVVEQRDALAINDESDGYPLRRRPADAGPAAKQHTSEVSSRFSLLRGIILTGGPTEGHSCMCLATGAAQQFS